MKKLKGRIAMSKSRMFLFALVALALITVAETAYAKPAACGNLICIEDTSSSKTKEF